MSASFQVELDTTAPQVTISSPRWIGDQVVFTVASDEPLAMAEVSLDNDVNVVYDNPSGTIIASPWPDEISGGTVTLDFADDVLNAGSASLDFSILELVELVADIKVYSEVRADVETYGLVSSNEVVYPLTFKKGSSVKPVEE